MAHLLKFRSPGERAKRILNRRTIAVTDVVKRDLSNFYGKLLEVPLVPKGSYNPDDSGKNDQQRATILYNECITTLERDPSNFLELMHILNGYPLLDKEVEQMTQEGKAAEIVPQESDTLPLGGAQPRQKDVADVGYPVRKQLFLSYGHEPEVKSFVLQLKHDLERKGFTVWQDKEDIPGGSEWRAKIGSSVYQCEGLIAVITNKYVSSEYCTGELNMAQREKKSIFPVFYEKVDFKQSERALGVQYVIDRLNCLYFLPKEDNYDNSFAKLVEGITKNRIKPHTTEEVDFVST